MSRPRVYKTEGIVLKRTDFGEADCIITVYTPDLGKIRAVAKGARKPKSKLGGHLDLLTQSSLLLAQGQSLDIITQSQTIESFLPLKRDLKAVSCALYLAELVEQFTAEQAENYPVYSLLQANLLHLCEAGNRDVLLRQFELQFLRHLGYQPELHRCLGCNSPIAPRTNFFSCGSGGVTCPDCAVNDPAARPISLDALKVMWFLLNSDHVSASRLRMSRELSCEIEQVTRGYIRYLLEREVKSLRFLDQVHARA